MSNRWLELLVGKLLASASDNPRVTAYLLGTVTSLLGTVTSLLLWTTGREGLGGRVEVVCVWWGRGEEQYIPTTQVYLWAHKSNVM